MNKFVCSLILALCAFTIVNVKPVSALSCHPTTLQEHIDAATVIFSGKATVVRETENLATFEASEFWKSDIGRVVNVSNIYKWTGKPVDDEPAFKVGQAYLVFAKYDPSSKKLFASIICGRTKLLSESADEKAALGPGKVLFDNVSFPINLSIGSAGTDVIKLQDFLETNRFLVMPPGISKGYFGNLTKNALVKFQQNAGIMPASGYLGPITREHIRGLVSSPQ